MIVLLRNVDMHSYAPSNIFLDLTNINFSAFDVMLCYATRITKESTNVHPWYELKIIIDKVHKNVCGHASLSDIKILLKQNNIWTEEAENYLNRVVDTCSK